ncbi:MAG: hypothetical protein J7J06_01055 [Methanosarcinales archaeon]|nr:hypothetical protein [Methanosarcinales archaeon]
MAGESPSGSDRHTGRNVSGCGDGCGRRGVARLMMGGMWNGISIWGSGVFWWIVPEWK